MLLFNKKSFRSIQIFSVCTICYQLLLIIFILRIIVFIQEKLIVKIQSILVIPRSFIDELIDFEFPFRCSIGLLLTSSLLTCLVKLIVFHELLIVLKYFSIYTKKLISNAKNLLIRQKCMVKFRMVHRILFSGSPRLPNTGFNFQHKVILIVFW